MGLVSGEFKELGAITGDPPERPVSEVSASCQGPQDRRSRSKCYHHLVVKLPNAEQAMVDIVKLRDYALSTSHPRGRHKARVFPAALGLTAADAEELRTALLESAKTGDAVRGTSDEFGTGYTVDFEMIRSTGRARVRGSWIVRMDDDRPRLTSCYVL